MTTQADPQTIGATTVVPTARRSRRQRRPTGAPAPLPRHIGVSGMVWIGALGVLLVWVVVVISVPSAQRLTERFDAGVLRQIARVRTASLTDVFERVNDLASGWALTVASVCLLVAMIAFRRWRHFFTFIASVLALELLGVAFYTAYARPRSYDVTIIGRWRAFSFPSAPVAVVTILAVGVVYSMVVPGRPRNIAKAIAIGVVGVVVAARLYLAVDHPLDVVVSLAFAVAIPLVAFRVFVPNEVFPVAYRKGKTAHLDVSGRRGAAIRDAVEQQLGLTVLDMQPVGLAASGGSTPLRLRVAGDPESLLFGKLYAMNHVRADRWYKLGRTVLYGRLEDEAPFQSVRRLVQYEDYTLRLMRDAGVRTPAPLGIVELTPEREYLLVTEFLDGAHEISDGPVDDTIIDEGLALIRRLWDNGLAHRDIKPANLMVKDGHVYVIDVAFAQVRPSPWREAVDLANMMLVLAVQSDAQRVYDRALAYFTPDEIAEAFAAARGVASPTQLRSVMKKDGRDLLAQFRALAPPRRPISLQRWGVRRVAIALIALAGLGLAMLTVFGLFTPAELPVVGRPECGTGNVMVLMAQSVPEASSVPCVAALPAGWEFGSVDVRDGRARFRLHSSVAGDNAVEVRLLPRDNCDTAAASEVDSDVPGMRQYETATNSSDGTLTRISVFRGGCATYRFGFDTERFAAQLLDTDIALSFQPRASLVHDVEDDFGLSLCGADAPSCTGGE